MGAVGFTMVAVVTSALSTGAGAELTTLRRLLRRAERTVTGGGRGRGLSRPRTSSGGGGNILVTVIKREGGRGPGGVGACTRADHLASSARRSAPKWTRGALPHPLTAWMMAPVWKADSGTEPFT